MIAGEQLARDSVHLSDRSEQAGVTGDTAHRVGVVVVHFAHQYALARRTHLGRREHLRYRLQPSRTHHREIDEIGRTQAERAEDPVAAEFIQSGYAYLLDHLTQQDEVQIGVNDLGAGRALSGRSRWI